MRIYTLFPVIRNSSCLVADLTFALIKFYRRNPGSWFRHQNLMNDKNDKGSVYFRPLDYKPRIFGELRRSIHYKPIVYSPVLERYNKLE